MPVFKAIAAMALNRTIGNQGQLPWHISEELQWFRQTTLHQTLLMGRKTFESMGCRPLPQRTTYVLSSCKTTSYEGAHTITSLDALMTLPDTIWLCGGAHMYEQFLPICSELLLSVIYKPYEGDAFFPQFENLFRKQAVLRKTFDFEVQHWINMSQ